MNLDDLKSKGPYCGDDPKAGEHDWKREMEWQIPLKFHARNKYGDLYELQEHQYWNEGAPVFDETERVRYRHDYRNGCRVVHYHAERLLGTHFTSTRHHNPQKDFALTIVRPDPAKHDDYALIVAHVGPKEDADMAAVALRDALRETPETRPLMDDPVIARSEPGDSANFYKRQKRDTYAIPTITVERGSRIVYAALDACDLASRRLAAAKEREKAKTAAAPAEYEPENAVEKPKGENHSKKI